MVPDNFREVSPPFVNVRQGSEARPFSAFLVLKEKGKIAWEFPPREAKGKRPAPTKAA